MLKIIINLGNYAMRKKKNATKTPILYNKIILIISNIFLICKYLIYKYNQLIKLKSNNIK